MEGGREREGEREREREGGAAGREGGRGGEGGRGRGRETESTGRAGSSTVDTVCLSTTIFPCSLLLLLCHLAPAMPTPPPSPTAILLDPPAPLSAPSHLAPSLTPLPSAALAPASSSRFLHSTESASCACPLALNPECKGRSAISWAHVQFVTASSRSRNTLVTLLLASRTD